MKKTTICSRCGKSPKINTSYCRDCQRLYEREYRLKNIDKIRKYMAEYQNTKYKEKKSIYDKKYRVNNLERIRTKNKEWNQKQRLSVIEHYGGMCACCGESRLEFLSIDHINGGGNKHRSTLKTSIYRWLKSNNYPEGFQVLCHNCNMSKSFYGYCPHQNKEVNYDK